MDVCEHCGDTFNVKEVKDVFFDYVHDEDVYIHLCEDCDMAQKRAFEGCI